MDKELDKWWKRVSFPTVAKASLGFGSEHWNSDARHYEGWEQLRDRRTALGRKSTRRELASELSSHLLSDVLVAAGGVETAILRMRVAAAELEAYAEKYKMKAQPGVPH